MVISTTSMPPPDAERGPTRAPVQSVELAGHDEHHGNRTLLRGGGAPC